MSVKNSGPSVHTKKYKNIWGFKLLDIHSFNIMLFLGVPHKCHGAWYIIESSLSTMVNTKEYHNIAIIPLYCHSTKNSLKVGKIQASINK